MPKLFGLDIAKIISDELGSGLLSVTLSRGTATGRTTGKLTAGLNPSDSEYSMKGFISDYEDRDVDGTRVATGDRKIGILGGSISDTTIVPLPNDKITIEGLTYNVVRVKRDPSGAYYECQCRGTSNAT